MFSRIPAALGLVAISAALTDATLRGAGKELPQAHRKLKEVCIDGMWVTVRDTGRAPRGRGDSNIVSTSARAGPTPPPRGTRPPRHLEECEVDDIETRSIQVGTKGDPHFKTHGGEMYDFHGGCDLVLLDSPSFMNGLGLLVHIRTKIETWWSYVESSVVRIGEETVEINGSSDSEWLHINGAPSPELEDEDWHMIKLENFFIRIKRTGENHEVKIYPGGNKEVIWMKTYHDFVKVEMVDNADNAAHFEGSQGLLGSFPAGEHLGRDNVLIEDINEFGQHWQVKPEEPKLFHTYDADWIIPADKKCAMPLETVEKQALRNRRLAESGLTMEMIEAACDHLEIVEDYEACVADVVATQDLDMASGGVW